MGLYTRGLYTMATKPESFCMKIAYILRELYSGTVTLELVLCKGGLHFEILRYLKVVTLFTRVAHFTA